MLQEEFENLSNLLFKDLITGFDYSGYDSYGFLMAYICYNIAFVYNEKPKFGCGKKFHLHWVHWEGETHHRISNFMSGLKSLKLIGDYALVDFAHPDSIVEIQTLVNRISKFYENNQGSDQTRR